MFSDYAYLYVEDDKLSQEVMQLIMENAMDVSTLTMLEDSTSFMERLREMPRKPDIILLDIHIKPLNGFELLQLLRSDPNYRDTKIIALTASVMSEEVERLQESGFNGAIGKPLSVHSFPALIRRI